MEYNTLTTEEKAQAVRSHIKNLQHIKYNLELSILTEQAVDVPSESVIIGYQLQLDDANDREAALSRELYNLTNGAEGSV